MIDTGFKCYGKPLFVGDILSVNGGYLGFVKVVEHENGFYLVDDGSVPEEANDTVKLNHNVNGHYQKVDKDNRYAVPPIDIYCDQCEYVIVGTVDVEGYEFVWNEECYEHTVMRSDGEVNVNTKCKLCHDDPSRKPPVNPVMEYFFERYNNAGFRVVPGHWPEFQYREEIDEWIDVMGAVLGN